MKRLLILGFVLMGCGQPDLPKVDDTWKYEKADAWYENVDFGNLNLLGRATCYGIGGSCLWIEVQIGKNNSTLQGYFTRPHEFGHVLDFRNGMEPSKKYYGGNAEKFANAFGHMYMKTCGNASGEISIDDCVKIAMQKATYFKSYYVSPADEQPSYYDLIWGKFLEKDFIIKDYKPL